ncbi:MAG TPA: DUF285 domain-containing protein, partial [Gammaproteobacteria bacterium]|nr:DUF285 domain-containing protein [Gammaproteobacteria bacterium]
MKKQLLFLLAALMLSLGASAQMVLQFDIKKSGGTIIGLSLFGTLDVTVNWGDYSNDRYTTPGYHRHIYATEGVYTVTITGNLTQYGNIPSDEIDNLVAVTSFGNIELTSLLGAFSEAINLTQVPNTLPSTVTNTSYMFHGCTSFNQNIGGWNVSNVTDMGGMFRGATAFNQNISNWNVSNVTDMRGMFYGATSFNQDINNWDVGNVKKMSSMFKGATAFNQNIGGWDVSNVTDMADMFEGVTLSTTHYNNLLIGWAAQNVKSGVKFSGGNSKYSSSAATAARAILTETKGWIITDGGPSNECSVSTLFVSDLTETTATSGGDVFADGGSSVTARGVVWSTSENPTLTSNQGKTTDGTGLGTFTSNITGLTENTTYYVRAYATNANGTVYGENRKFTAELPMKLKFDTHLSEGKTITLPLFGTVDVTVDWGDGKTNTYTTAGNYEHIYVKEDVYNVSITGNLTQFGKGYTITPNIEKLIAVTSFGKIGLTSLVGAFYKAVNLTQVPTTLPSTVTNTVSLFGGATNFNQDISNWDVSKVTNMRSMFAEASAFNQNIGSWNVSNVTDMESMFFRATAFNQDIGNWNVSNVTDMESMFNEASAFNQDIGNWDVGKVTSLFCMFNEASAFNQNIGSWNVSKVTDMFYMFKNATTFNQNLGGWD